MGLCNNEQRHSISMPRVPIRSPTTTTQISSPTGPMQVDFSIPLRFSALRPLCLDLFADGGDFSWQAIQRGRIRYYQRQLANQIQLKNTATLALLTDALHIHLNVGQNMTMDTPRLFMSLETVTAQSLSRRTLRQPDQAHIQLPPTLQLTPSNQTTLSLRVRSFPPIIITQVILYASCSSP
jgi:hypothetical protein